MPAVAARTADRPSQVIEFLHYIAGRRTIAQLPARDSVDALSIGIPFPNDIPLRFGSYEGGPRFDLGASACRLCDADFDRVACEREGRGFEIDDDEGKDPVLCSKRTKRIAPVITRDGRCNHA
jgi:hypothetical protein